MTWYAGAGQPNFGLAFNAGDIINLADGSAALSTIADIANNNFGDSLADLSYAFTIASATIPPGSAISFYCYPLNQDGTTYGDGLLTPTNGQVAVIPTLRPWSREVPAAAGVTSIVGTITRIILPAANFRFAILNKSGQIILSGTIKYFTYN